jgi:hypothetical protein
MANRPFLHHFRTGAAAAATLIVLGTAAGAAAQTQRTSAPLSVSATVVRSCTVEQVRVPTLPSGPSSTGQPVPPSGPAYRLRCGQQTVTYPVQPGSPTVVGKSAPATVAGSADGRGVVIQF